MLASMLTFSTCKRASKRVARPGLPASARQAVFIFQLQPMTISKRDFNSKCATTHAEALVKNVPFAACMLLVPGRSTVPSQQITTSTCILSALLGAQWLDLNIHHHQAELYTGISLFRYPLPPSNATLESRSTSWIAAAQIPFSPITT